MSPWTPDRIATLQRLRTEGLSWAQIGEALGVTGATVSAKAYRLDREAGIQRRAPTDRTLGQRYRELLAAGVTPMDAKAQLGITQKQATRYSYRNGLGAHVVGPEDDVSVPKFAYHDQYVALVLSVGDFRATVDVRPRAVSVGFVGRVRAF